MALFKFFPKLAIVKPNGFVSFFCSKHGCLTFFSKNNNNKPESLFSIESDVVSDVIKKLIIKTETLKLNLQKQNLEIKAITLKLKP